MARNRQSRATGREAAGIMSNVESERMRVKIARCKACLEEILFLVKTREPPVIGVAKRFNLSDCRS